MTNETVVIGIAWDKFSDNLKAAMLSDFLKIKDAFESVQIELLAPKDADTSWVDSLAFYAELPIVKGRKPEVWRLYIVEDEAYLPDYAVEIVRKNLTPEISDGIPLLPNVEKYPTLDRQSDMRIVPPGVSLTLNRMPPRQPIGNQPYTLPQNYFLSPFI